MPLLGTMQNPLQVQQAPGQAYAQQMEGERQRRLAEALAQQELVTSRSTGRNILGAVLQHFATQATAKRGEKNAAEGFALQQKLELEQEAKRYEQKQSIEQKAYDTRYKHGIDVLKLLPEEAHAIALDPRNAPKILELRRQQPKNERPLVVNGNLVDPTGKVLFTAPRDPQAPPAPRDLTFAEYQALPPEQRAAFDAFKGRGGDAPSGYRQTVGGALEPIPGGPADPANSAGKMPPEVAARSALVDEFLENAPAIRENIAKGDQTGLIDAAGAMAGVGRGGEVRRQIMSGVDALRRGLTGAGMSGQETNEYVQRYLPAVQDNAATLASKHDQLVAELTRYRDNLKQGRSGAGGGGGAPSAPASGGGWSIRPLD